MREPILREHAVAARWISVRGRLVAALVGSSSGVRSTVRLESAVEGACDRQGEQSSVD